MRSIVIAILLSASCAAHAEGQFYSGNQLYEILLQGNRAFFNGYVAGAHDAARIQGFFCSPPSATLGQIADVAGLFLVEHPELRHRDADVLINLALRQQWPCPTQNRAPAPPQPQGGSL